ncbi:MAG TPA: transcriptional regulator [Candidatus Saccharimonadales bacterium]|nr:transcriptional regulator [Candidatus Saccharimonadales bacterium]
MTDRQTAILSAIVELYAKTAEPVGSQALVDRFETSSATIRAEMAELEAAGYIMQPHISAGRIPTDKGYRVYVNALSDERQPLHHAPEPTISRINQLVAKRLSSVDQAERAIKVATGVLTEVTHNLGLATLSDSIYLHGMASLFSQPEFFGGRRAYEVARLLDSLDEWLDEAAPADRVSVYIGRENPVGKSSGCSLIIARFASPYSDHSYIGVLGPTRQNYGQVINLVDYTGRMLQEALA